MSCLAAAGVVLKERLGGNRSARRKTTRRPRNVLKPSRPMSCLAAAGVVWMSALALKCLSAGLLDLWRSLGQRTVSREREGPWTGAHPLFRVFFLLQPGLLCLRSFFFNQSSFFGLVRPGGESVREMRDGGDVVGARCRSSPSDGWRLSACPPMVEIMVTMKVEITTGGHASPRPPTCYVLLLLPMSKSAECCRKDNCCCCNFKCFAAAGPALGGSSQAPPPSPCDLLRPGLLCSAMGQTKAKNRNGNGGDWSETQWRCLAENQ